MKLRIIPFIVSVILSSSVLSAKICKIYNKPIEIKHDLNPKDWFMVHAEVFIFTIALMLCADVISLSISGIERMPIGFLGLLYLFIQNNGLVIFVMILSSMIYNHLTEQIGFDYFIERHLSLKKWFFTVVCFIMGGLYLYGIYRESGEKNILDYKYRLIMTWFIVLIQIWVGFGMKTDFRSKVGEKKLGHFNKTGNSSKIQKETRYMNAYWISILVIPVFVALLAFVDSVVSRRTKEELWSITIGIGVAAVIMLLTIAICTFMFIPNKKWSIIRFNWQFAKAQASEKQEYFMRARYTLKKTDDEYRLKVFELEKYIDKEEQFPQEYIDRVNAAFQKEEYVFSLKKYEEEEIKQKLIDQLIEISQKRIDLLREGFDIAYKLCDEEEKRKSLEAIE